MKFSGVQRIGIATLLALAGARTGVAAEALKLSDQATKNLGIKTQKVTPGRELTLPKSALVQSLDQNGVYRLRQGAFERIPVQVLKRTDSQITVYLSEPLLRGDQLAIEGVALLRVAEMQKESTQGSQND